MSQRQVKSHRKKKKKQFPRANLNRYVVCIPHRGILSKAKLLATKKQVFTIQNSTASWERYLIPVQQQRYGNTGCGVFKRGYKISNFSWHRINVLKGNYWILRIGLMRRCQKVSIILENKVIWKLMLSKNVNNKKCAPKLIFFNNEKSRNDFWHRKLTLKVKFWHY